MLRVSGLTVRLDPRAHTVLDGIGFALSPGEVLGVVGPNGSGKSTLGRALAGVVEVERGDVSWGDHGGAPRVGLVLQDPAAQVLAATVADDVALGGCAAGAPPDVIAAAVTAQLDRAGLRAVAARDPARLSGGQQQRTAVAAVSAVPLDVLVLDEPTAMLDPTARQELPHLLRAHARETSCAVIWITQLADELGVCDAVLVLDAGEVVWHGPTDAYVADPSIAATWGLDLPFAARHAHGLRRAGRWPHGVSIPATEEALVATLAGEVGRGG